VQEPGTSGHRCPPGSSIGAFFEDYVAGVCAPPDYMMRHRSLRKGSAWSCGHGGRGSTRLPSTPKPTTEPGVHASREHGAGAAVGVEDHSRIGPCLGSAARLRVAAPAPPRGRAGSGWRRPPSQRRDAGASCRCPALPASRVAGVILDSGASAHLTDRGGTLLHRLGRSTGAAARLFLIARGTSPPTAG